MGTSDNIYIYHHQVTLTARSYLALSLSLSIYIYIYPSSSFIVLGCFSRLHPVSTQTRCKSLLIGQHWYVHVKESIRELRIPQSSSITEASPSDCLVSYPGHLLGVVLLCRDAFGVFCSPCQLGQSSRICNISRSIAVE